MTSVSTTVGPDEGRPRHQHHHHEDEHHRHHREHRDAAGAECCELHSSAAAESGIVFALVGGALVLTTVIARTAGIADEIAQIPAFVGAIVLWVPLLQGAYREIKSGRPSSSTLVAIAIGAAMATGKYVTGGGLAFILLLMNRILQRTAWGAHQAIEQLVQLTPDTARRLDENGNEEAVGIEDLKVEDRVRVLPGENFPADGVVVQGRSTIRQASLTGESAPVEVEADVFVDGRVVMDGNAEEVVRRYEGYLERLTWLGDDVDDKSFNWESERDAYEDVALPESGNSVSRWPGLGGVQVTGLWINGATELACELDPDQPLRLRLALRARRAGKYSLRYLFTFWNSRGKRLGVAENERHRMSLQVGTRFEVETEIAPRVFSQGIYLLSISVLSLPEAGSAANEGSVRQDVIYKSARIVMTSAQPLTGPEVTYHVPMQVELT